MSTIQKLTTWRGWLHGLLAAIIGGSASAGLTYLTVNGAHAAGVDVPMLNFKTLGLILISSGLVSAFAYLKQSPLPDAEEEKATPPMPVSALMLGLCALGLTFTMLGNAGCTSVPISATPRQQLVADGVEDVISIGLVPVLAKNPDYVPASRAVATALGTFAGDTLTPADVAAFLERTPLAADDRRLVEGVVNAAWQRYSKRYAQQVNASVRPDVRLFLAAVANGIQNAIAAVPAASRS